MKVVFLTEGSRSIGLGHITRCFAISEAFYEKKIPFVFIINGDESIKPLLNNIDHKIVNWINNQNSYIDLINKNDIVVIDSYLANIGIYKQITKLAKVVIYIDDNNRLNYPEGIVVNGNINASSFSYLKNSKSKYLLGSNYAPIRKEFWNTKKNKVNKKLESVLVTFGSGDVSNLTPQIIEYFIENFSNLKLNIIVGSGYKNIEILKKYKSNKVNLFFSPNAKKMKKLMEDSDLIVSASGQTINEILNLGKPGIIVSVVDNQNNTFNYLKKRKLFITLKKDKKSFKNDFIKAIKSLQKYETRKKYLDNVLLVDGQGARRIIETALFFYKKKILFLTNNIDSYVLSDWLKKNEQEVVVYNGKISESIVNNCKPDLLISYNYKYIISESVINMFKKGMAINLHISYLPWNKGSNPNFWSFMKNTLKGVTIHCLDKGLDTGDILYQELINFSKKETLNSTYFKLNELIVNLFKKNWLDIKFNNVKPKKQKGKGSSHTLKEFSKYKNILDSNGGWNIKISKLNNLFIK